MSDVKQTVEYLAACEPEMRDALIAIALSDAKHPAFVAVDHIREQPLLIGVALMGRNGGKKRGRPRGSKAKVAAA